MAYPIGLLDYPQAFDSTRSDYPIAQWSNRLLGWPVKCGLFDDLSVGGLFDDLSVGGLNKHP